MWYTADAADNIRKAVAYGFGDQATADKMVNKFDTSSPVRSGSAILSQDYALCLQLVRSLIIRLWLSIS